jgi:hypothetical protein
MSRHFDPFGINRKPLRVSPTPRHRQIVLLLSQLSILLSTSTCTPEPRLGSLVASHGATALLDELAAATRSRQPLALAQLFTKECSRSSAGLRFDPEPLEAGIFLVRWQERGHEGTLIDDLMGQLTAFASVRSANYGFVDFRYLGRGRARAVLRVIVDGILRDGALRFDRGRARVELRQWVDGVWRIDAFESLDLHSVIARKPLLYDASQRLGDLSSAGGEDAWSGSLPPGAQSPKFMAGDFDGDGRTDLFVPGAGLGRLYLGDGEGGFRDARGVEGAPPAAKGYAAAATDVDGDGDLDLLVVTAEGDSTLVVNDGGRLRVAGPEHGLRGLGPGATAAWIDVNRDGRPDLLFAPAGRAASGGASLQVWLNRAGRFELARPGAVPMPAMGPVAALCVADLDDDGWTDLVVIERLGPPRVFLQRPGGFRQASGPTRPDLLGQGCAISDLDGDGALDVIVLGRYLPERWMYQQPGFPWPRGPFARLSSRPTQVAALARGTLWLRQTSQGHFEEQALAETSAVSGETALVAADLAQNGRSDVLLFGLPDTHRGGGWIERYTQLTLPALLRGGRAPAPDSWPAGATVSWLRVSSPEAVVELGGLVSARLPAPVSAVAFLYSRPDSGPELLLRLVDGRFRVLSSRRSPIGNALSLRLLSRRVTAGATLTVEVPGRRIRGHLEGGVATGPVGVVRIGLGSATRADRVEISWPDGTRETVRNLAVPGAYMVWQGNPEALPGLVVH